MAAKKITKTQIKKRLQEIINDLASERCTFWACPGPNRPIIHMKTCSKCYLVKELRQLKRDI